MRKISRRLLLSALTVVLTVIALGTTTFAWFTITNTANISSFETQITTDEGIEIALGRIDETLTDLEETKFVVNSPAHLNWVTTLSSADVLEYIETEIAANFRFEHLTSTDGLSFNSFSSDAVNVGNATDGFVSLPIHFRSANVDSVNWTDIVLTGRTPLPTWTTDVDAYTDASGTARVRGDVVTVDPSDAIRIAIDGYVTDADAVFVYEKEADTDNIVLNTGGDLTQPVDPDNDPATLNSYTPSERGAHSYYFAKTGLLPIGITAVNTPATITTLGAGVNVLTLLAGNEITAGMAYYNNLSINIWIEGWDPNAYNAILDEYINITFKFEAPLV